MEENTVNSIRLNKAISENQIVILTGGLGPTADDITKPLLNAFFNGNFLSFI